MITYWIFTLPHGLGQDGVLVRIAL